MTTQRPQEALRQLCDIFPAFADSWAEEEAPSEDGLLSTVLYYKWTPHAVLQNFLEYFAPQSRVVYKKAVAAHRCVDKRRHRHTG